MQCFLIRGVAGSVSLCGGGGCLMLWTRAALVHNQYTTSTGCAALHWSMGACWCVSTTRSQPAPGGLDKVAVGSVPVLGGCVCGGRGGDPCAHKSDGAGTTSL